jgi:hypothetical protein
MNRRVCKAHRWQISVDDKFKSDNGLAMSAKVTSPFNVEKYSQAM